MKLSNRKTKGDLRQHLTHMTNQQFLNSGVSTRMPGYPVIFISSPRPQLLWCQVSTYLKWKSACILTHFPDAHQGRG